MKTLQNSSNHISPDLDLPFIMVIKKMIELTEAMFFPRQGKQQQQWIADILIDKNEFFSYCNKFECLGAIFTPSLKDDLDIQQQSLKHVECLLQ